MDSLAHIFNLIRQERVYQDRKWGSIKENPHTIEEWVEIIDVLGATAYNNQDTDKVNDVKSLTEILQIAAVSCACLEQYEDELKDYKGR